MGLGLCPAFSVLSNWKKKKLELYIIEKVDYNYKFNNSSWMQIKLFKVIVTLVLARNLGKNEEKVDNVVFILILGACGINQL